MEPTTEDDGGDRIDAAVERIYAGEVAMAAIVRGESVDPDLLDRAADGLADLLSPDVTGPTWTMDDVDRVRRLRSLLTDGAPSPEARALAAAHVPIFLGEEGAVATERVESRSRAAKDRVRDLEKPTR